MLPWPDNCGRCIVSLEFMLRVIPQVLLVVMQHILHLGCCPVAFPSTKSTRSPPHPWFRTRCSTPGSACALAALCWEAVFCSPVLAFCLWRGPRTVFYCGGALSRSFRPSGS